MDEFFHLDDASAVLLSIAGPTWHVLAGTYTGNAYSLTADCSIEEDLPDPSLLLALDPVGKANDLPQDALGMATSPTQTPAPAHSSFYAPRLKQGKSLYVSVDNLRRSTRIHNRDKGFKTSLYKDRDCLGCASDPPLLSTSVVHDLGSSFCNMNPSSLTEEKLNAKPVKKGAVGRPKKPKKPEDDKAGGSKAKKSTK